MAHRYGVTLFAFLFAACLTGIACVWFMRSFEFVLKHRFDFASIGAWCWVTTPLLFLAAAELIKRVAPFAAGTGIPQAIFAAKNLQPATEKRLWPLYSPLTLVVKIVAILIGLAAGASMGREGPTVHVGVCIFTVILLIFRRITGIEFDMRSAVVAGGAAGLAAAFNTPLAGVTFAIEELTVDYFAGIKEFVLMAIIIAALSAKSMTGEYGYFGKLLEPPGVPWFATVLTGLAGGLLGSLFSIGLLRGQAFFARLQAGRQRYLTTIVLGTALTGLAYATQLRVSGPGNEVAQSLLSGDFSEWALFYPATKMIATLLTYWSGMAGGVFAPCLSIGAAIGACLGHWLSVPTAGCALLGMAAFLSGTIQAPITTFVIIFEMSGNHQMLPPLMLTSLLGFMISKVTGAPHLYPALARRYESLLENPTNEKIMPVRP